MVAVLLAGMAAGTINAVVGSGTLITFPTLLAFGVPPVTANVSNTIGLVPGVASGVIGYRRELRGQRGRAVRLGSASILGGVVGALLLLVLPDGAFKAIVPALILLGLVLVVLQPRISAWVDARHEGAVGAFGPWWVWPAVLGTGVYGGYFGAAQGVILMGVLGIGIADSMQRLNGLKNVLAGLVNGVAGLIFLFVADVDWTVVALIAAGSVVGGQLGATVGRQLSPVVLRVVIVIVGLAALGSFLVK
jgi:uncharacterized membrane protein YfcA